MKNEPATSWSLRPFHGSAAALRVLAVPTRATENNQWDRISDTLA
ncbi:MAG: hypothetical protein ACE5EH_06755 [Gammaproteobacteria bacterium]